jgi:signal transduction histidine kinase
VPRSTSAAYLLSIGIVALATLGTFVIYPWIEPSISLLFFLAVVVPGIYGGYGPALLSAALSTLALAYFFVPPRYSFNIGVDDGVRLSVFATVAVATASLSAARRRAEDAQKRSLLELRSAIDTLRKVSGWPVLIGADSSSSLARMLGHAAAVVGARRAIVGWESDDEPWLYVADSEQPGRVVTRHDAAELQPLVAELAKEAAVGSAPFETEHLSGRVFFVDMERAAGSDTDAAVELVAREVGTSLDQLYLAERLRQVAVREDRLKLSRDLHDGVLQALTGIRLELQAIAAEPGIASGAHDRLLAIERALAIEQRELRLFIDELKPEAAAPAESGPLAERVEQMCARLSAEWKTPIVVRVSPPDLALPAEAAQPIRLMVHEAIVNALKHARASRIEVAIEGAARALRIVVADDGRGFPFRGRVSHDELARANIGPASLRGRVAALDGRLAIDSSEAGSRVELTLPLTLTS